MAAKQRKNAGARVPSHLQRPHFFKVLLGGFARQLRIPPSFTKYISEESSSEAVLQAPNGRSWPVQLQKSAKGSYFSSGWAEFVEHHALKEHELLVFRYNGDLRFGVQIFGSSACEREDLLYGDDGVPPPASATGNGKDSPPALLAIKAEPAEPDALENVGIPSSTQQQKNLTPLPAVNGLPMPFADPHEPIPIKMEPSPRKHAGSFAPKRRRRPATEEESARAQRAAGSFRSDLPHAAIRMATTSICWAKVTGTRFPVEFSRSHLPRERTNMTLRDPSGKAWTVGYIPANDHQSRDRLCGGWHEFVVGNCLEEGDYCVFELTGPAEFQVHIFSALDDEP